MSCDVTKLEYLEKTKRMFREKLDPQGKVITDETPFRDYVNIVPNGAPKNATLSEETIEKTYVMGLFDYNSTKNMGEWLVANAVPEYFDEIRYQDENGNMQSAILCVTNGLVILSMEHAKITGADVIVRAENSVGTESGKVIGFKGTTPKELNNDWFFRYAYKCKNGICLSESEDGGVCLTITKDNAGNTVIILCADGEKKLRAPSLTENNKLYVISQDITSIYSKDMPAVNCAGEQLTALQSLPVGDTANYTPSVFIMPYTQHTGQSDTIIIDGCKYLSNGLWCVKDE